MGKDQQETGEADARDARLTPPETTASSPATAESAGDGLLTARHRDRNPQISRLAVGSAVVGVIYPKAPCTPYLAVCIAICSAANWVAS